MSGVKSSWTTLYIDTELCIGCFLAARGIVEKALVTRRSLRGDSSSHSRRRRRRLREKADDEDNSCSSYRKLFITSPAAKTPLA